MKNNQKIKITLKLVSSLNEYKVVQIDNALDIYVPLPKSKWRKEEILTARVGGFITEGDAYRLLNSGKYDVTVTV